MLSRQYATASGQAKHSRDEITTPSPILDTREGPRSSRSESAGLAILNSDSRVTGALLPQPDDTMNKNTKEETKNWSAKVTRESHALALEEGVFTWKDPRRIALSLQASAEASTQRKSSPFRSAMSMLVFYINRAGTNLDDEQRRILEQAKDELRQLYHRETHEH